MDSIRLSISWYSLSKLSSLLETILANSWSGRILSIEYWVFHGAADRVDEGSVGTKFVAQGFLNPSLSDLKTPASVIFR